MTRKTLALLIVMIAVVICFLSWLAFYCTRSAVSPSASGVSSAQDDTVTQRPSISSGHDQEIPHQDQNEAQNTTSSAEEYIPYDATSSPARLSSMLGHAGLQAIAKGIRMLAMSGDPDLVAFAVELEKPLVAHGLGLPFDISDLSTRRRKDSSDEAASSDTTGNNVAYTASHLIVQACEESIWTKNRTFGISTGLRNDLLTAVACHSPSPLARTEAAFLLADRAMPSGEGKSPLDVSPEAALMATEEALKFAISSKMEMPSRERLVALRSLELKNSLETLLVLKIMVLNVPTETALEEYLDVLSEVINHANIKELDQPAQQIVSSLGSQATSIKSRAAQFAKLFKESAEIRLVVVNFVDAATRNDADELAQCLTKSAWSRIASGAIPALDWLANSNGVASCDVVSVGPVEAVGPQRYVSVQFTLRDASGTSRSAARILYVTRQDGGWLLGESSPSTKGE